MGVINGNNNQVTITVNDMVPPDNVATVDKNGAVGNTYTKTQFDNSLATISSEIDSKIDNIQQLVESDFRGTLNPSDAAPTEDGSYKPEVSSDDDKPSDPNSTADWGKVYPNAGNLRAKSGYETMFYKKGTVWKRSETKMPEALDRIPTWFAGNYASGKQVLYEGNIYELTEPAISSDIPGESSKWIRKSNLPVASSLLTADQWNVNKQINKSLLISGNKTIELIIDDGVEGFLMVEGSGTITVANKSITLGSKPMLIGVKRMGSVIFAFNKEVTESINPSNGGNAVSFSGGVSVNGSNVWEASVKDGNWNHTGIDSVILPANTSGRIWFRYLSGDGGGCIGFTSGSSAVGYAGMVVGFWRNGSPTNSWGKTDSGVVSEFSTISAEIGSFYGILRAADGKLYWQSSSDGLIWTTLHTFTSINTAALRVVCDIRGQSADRISQPKRNF